MCCWVPCTRDSFIESWPFVFQCIRSLIAQNHHLNWRLLWVLRGFECLSFYETVVLLRSCDANEWLVCLGHTRALVRLSRGQPGIMRDVDETHSTHRIDPPTYWSKSQHATTVLCVLCVIPSWFKHYFIVMNMNWQSDCPEAINDYVKGFPSCWPTLLFPPPTRYMFWLGTTWLDLPSFSNTLHVSCCPFRACHILLVTLQPLHLSSFVRTYMLTNSWHVPAVPHFCVCVSTSFRNNSSALAFFLFI